jgi:phosphatidyl-myo-inositol alpha-mannosyltransferase
MRVGLVCPYSLDVPGGAQNHVRDLAEALIDRGHHVSVLAPADDDSVLPAYVVAAGRAIPVPYNGSVARLTFGPVAYARVRRWISQGEFDVIHIHEPATPSLSLLALWAADGPLVGTFHSSNARSRAMTAASGLLTPALEKLSARIAVSEDARSTLVQHLGGEPVIIPNGIYVSRFAGRRQAAPGTSASSRAGDGPVISFVGRMDEPRKGLGVLLAAVPEIARARPDVHLRIGGKGDIGAASEDVPPEFHDRVEFLGMPTDDERDALYADSDVYVAPQTGGESFGMTLIEGMAAGAAVLASDIGAFRRVLADGEFGRLFSTGDPAALAAAAIALMADDPAREVLAAAGQRAAWRYDWSVLCDAVVDVYRLVTAGSAGPVTARC